MDHQRFGRCTFDPATRTLRCDGEEIILRAKVAELLALLLEHPNQVVENDSLRDQLWPDGFVEAGNLAQQVYLLRKALAVDPSVSVDNVARQGYRLHAKLPAQPGPRSGSGTWVYVRSLLAAVAAACVLILPSGAALLRPNSAVDAPAERDYTLGKYFLQHRGFDNVNRAKAYFEEAVADAPASSLGYTGLAEVWGVAADTEPLESPQHADLARHAYDSALMAVTKNPNASESHAALGLALLEMRAPRPRAMAEFRQAIALDPRNADAQEWYAIQLLLAGNLLDALHHAAAASEIQPENVAVTSWYALIRYYLNDPDNAVDGFKTALEINPDYQFAQVGLVAALVQSRRYREAQLVLAQIRVTDPSTARGLRALAAITDLRLGLRQAAAQETHRLLASDMTRRRSDDDGFVVAALALNGRAVEARRLCVRVNTDTNPYLRLMVRLDPLVGPIIRSLGSSV